MSSNLENLQRQFTAALRRPDCPPPATVYAADAAKRIKRFNVYRNTMHASLAAALAARYPVIQRLLGEDFFQAMALVFIRQQPPTSPVLAQYGEHLAPFLEDFEPAQSWPYLADVARLEWQRHLAYHAADAPIIDIVALAAIAPEQLGDLRLHLHPAVHWIASDYPILAIWRTNSQDAIVQPVGAAAGQCVLVTRPDLEVLVSALPPGSDAFMAALAEAEPMGRAAELALNDTPSFDLPAALAALFAAGAIADIAVSQQYT